MRNTLRTILFLTILTALPVEAFLVAGTYNGKDGDKDKVILSLQEIPGREGSFMAMLVTGDQRRIELYLVDQLDSAYQFAMQPMGVTKSGRFGVVDDNPRYLITPTKQKKNKVKKFSIIPANSFSGNSTYTFKKEKDKKVWLGVEEGQYRLDKEENVAQISLFDPVEHKATVVITATRYAGTYTIFEEQSKVFVVKRNEVTRKGLNVSNLPTALAVFFKRCKRTCKKQLVLLSPENGQVLTAFTKGKRLFSMFSEGESGNFGSTD